MSKSAEERQSYLVLILLILAGEAVFILPFVLPRIFRLTVLTVFDLTNTELGYCFSVYGIVAMLAYLIGGPLADRYSPQFLMSSGLILTALGGLYAATYPSYHGMLWLYGYWGVTTILLFWAALIKATRLWGGDQRQGRAFSLLDAGRGAVAATFGLLGVVITALFVSADIESLSISDQRSAFARLLLAFSGLVVVVATLIVFVLRTAPSRQSSSVKRWDPAALRTLCTKPEVYFLSLIVLTAYSGYKVQDVFSLYASNVMGYTDIQAAYFGTYLLYMRPMVGLVLGLLPDHRKPSSYLLGGFSIMLLGSIWMASGAGHSYFIIVVCSVVTVSVGIYATRCLYFSIMEEASIPLALTGTAVGLISVIGYTPDIFMGPIMGYFLDHYDGALAFSYIFCLLALFSIVGLGATLLLRRR